MKITGRQIQRFKLYEPIVLDYNDDGDYLWYEAESQKDFACDTLLEPGTFTLESVYINSQGEVGFDYADDDASDIQPEFDILNLLQLEKDNLIEFIKE